MISNWSAMGVPRKGLFNVVYVSDGLLHIGAYFRLQSPLLRNRGRLKMENTYFNLWQTIRNKAEQSAAEEPMLASFLHMTVLRHDSLERVLAFHLSSKLANPTMDMRTLYELYLHALEKEPSIGEAARACRFCISKDTTPFRPTASTTACGRKGAKRWPISCKTALPKCSASISIRPPVSGRGL